MNKKIKAGAITNLTDARYFAAWEAEWLGFCLDSGSERAVPIATVRAIKEWVDGVKIVGEFGWQEIQEITAIANDLSLDGIQLNMFSTLEDAVALKDYFLFKEIVVEKDKELATLQHVLESFSTVVGCFILNFSKNSILFEDLMLEATLLKAWCQRYPLMIQADVNTDQLMKLLEEIQPFGIHLQGGEEEKTGFKSFEELDEIFERL